MRIGIMIGAATLALAGQLVSAEARGGRIGGGVVGLRGSLPTRGAAVSPHRLTPPDTLLSNAISHRAGAAPRYTSLPGAEAVTRGMPVLAMEARPPAAASVAPVQKAVAARPWCPPERLVGSGAGFCLIN